MFESFISNLLSMRGRVTPIPEAGANTELAVVHVQKFQSIDVTVNVGHNKRPVVTPCGTTGLECFRLAVFRAGAYESQCPVR